MQPDSRAHTRSVLPREDCPLPASLGTTAIISPLRFGAFASAFPEPAQDTVCPSYPPLFPSELQASPCPGNLPLALLQKSPLPLNSAAPIHSSHRSSFRADWVWQARWEVMGCNGEQARQGPRSFLRSHAYIPVGTAEK